MMPTKSRQDKEQNKERDGKFDNLQISQIKKFSSHIYIMTFKSLTLIFYQTYWWLGLPSPFGGRNYNLEEVILTALSIFDIGHIDINSSFKLQLKSFMT